MSAERPSPPPSAIDRLREQFPWAVRNALLAGVDGCRCGHCNQHIEPRQATRSHTCPNSECDTVWNRIIITDQFPGHERLPGGLALTSAERILGQVEPNTRSPGVWYMRFEGRGRRVEDVHIQGDIL